MLNSMTRRGLLATVCAASTAIALAGCTTVTSGSTKAVTLNVAKVTAYATAGLNAVTTVTDALALFPALSAYAVPLAAVETVLAVALSNFSKAAGSSITVSYDDTSVRSQVDSILSDIQSIASQIASIVPAMATQAALGITDKTVSTVQLAHDALTTIISVFQALLSSNVAMVTPRMGESTALRVLRV